MLYEIYVKKWIGNERRKRKLGETMPEREAMVGKSLTIKRTTSGYNMFTSKLISSGTGLWCPMHGY